MSNISGRSSPESFPPYSYALYGAGTELILICVMSILLNVICLVVSTFRSLIKLVNKLQIDINAENRTPITR